jgi:hypothetical protein
MVNLGAPPTDDKMLNESGKVWLGWIDWFNNFGSFFKGTYEFGDGYEVTPRKVDVYFVTTDATKLNYGVNAEGFLTTYDTTTGAITRIYTNNDNISLPSFQHKLIVQGTLKRI